MKNLPKHMQRHATKLNKRVKLHPGLSIWMLGYRYGEVVKIGRQYLTVKTDQGKTFRVHPDNVEVI